jgi:hypothetical protein
VSRGTGGWRRLSDPVWVIGWEEGDSIRIEASLATGQQSGMSGRIFGGGSCCGDSSVMKKVAGSSVDRSIVGKGGEGGAGGLVWRGGRAGCNGENVTVGWWVGRRDKLFAGASFEKGVLEGEGLGRASEAWGNHGE